MERSSEFIQGYNACAVGISRSRNPYKDLPRHNTPQDDPFWQWHDGWNTRFFGEAIYEGTPDP